MVDGERVRKVSRRLRDLCEPIAGSVYFVPEAQDNYKALGLTRYGDSYFVSRGACLGNPSAEVITAAFGVFNPAVVSPAVEAGWNATDPPTILRARYDGAVAGLRRILGEADVRRIVDILRPVMESQSCSGRALFAGLRSLPFPDDALGQLFRVCDYVRERRGDGHVAAWIAADCDPVEITLLTELLWGLELERYVYTRGWSKDDVTAAIARLEDKGYIRDRAFTDEGRSHRRAIESATDMTDTNVVTALGGDADELFGLLEPLQQAVLAAKAYPADPGKTMSNENS
jgi:helix-turn-helix protein